MKKALMLVFVMFIAAAGCAATASAQLFSSLGAGIGAAYGHAERENGLTAEDDVARSTNALHEGFSHPSKVTILWDKPAQHKEEPPRKSGHIAHQRHKSD